MPDVTEVTETPQTPETAQPDATGTSERTFKQSEVESMIRDRLAAASRKAEEATRRATAEAERKAAEEQGKFQELYQRTLADLETERQQRKVAELTMLKRDVGARFGLPAQLVERLHGDDEESLTADAKALAAVLPKAPPPNINSAAGTPASTQRTLADDVAREKAARYGVSPELFKQNYRPIGGQ